MESISDIFGRMRTNLPTGRILSERSELIRFFSEEIDRPAKQVGIRLAHYSLSQLYALKSAYADRLKRNGKETARKYYWSVSRTQKI